MCLKLLKGFDFYLFNTSLSMKIVTSTDWATTTVDDDDDLLFTKLS